jgi:hypothetical protein
LIIREFVRFACLLIAHCCGNTFIYFGESLIIREFVKFACLLIARCCGNICLFGSSVLLLKNVGKAPIVFISVMNPIPVV